MSLPTEIAGYDRIRIQKLLNQHAIAEVSICNGDRHNGNDNPTDKNRNSELWTETRDKWIDPDLERLAKKYGYNVQYPGIYACLEKNGQTFYDE